jgi:hypothetical protein
VVGRWAALVAEIGCDSTDNEEERVATPERRGGGIGGISLGGIIVIVGIVVMLVWSVLVGVIIVLIGLIAFGGFARGRWY